jgi:xanthine dehydrogenase YagS FAD-binding subunit
MLTNDIMPGFELYQPTDLKAALALLDRYGTGAWALAGGHDSLTWFKTRLKHPKAVVDLSGIPGLSGIRAFAEGIEIGAMTTLTAVETDPLIRTQYRVLAEAAGKVASPQIRSTGTIGGNVAQHARCWYYRSGLNCWRAGGDGCFAQNKDSVNREHAIFDRGDCVAVNPSDIAPALVALDAKFVIESSRGRRVVDCDTFFVGVDTSVSTLNALRPGEILTAVRLSPDWAAACFYFEKVADRQTWDFPLVNIAAALKLANGRIDRARIVCGAASATPKRFAAVEERIAGRAADEETARLAGELAVQGAKPLSANAFKVQLVASLVTRAIRDARA